MTDIETLLSDSDALERYRSLVETALLAGGPLTEVTRGFLELRAAELGVHRLDAEQLVTEILSLASVQTMIAMRPAQRERTQQADEALRAELHSEQNAGMEALVNQLHAEQAQRSELAAQMSQMQSLIERLHQRLTSFEQTLTDIASLAQTPAPVPPSPVPTPTTPTSGSSRPPRLPDDAELVLIPASDFLYGSRERAGEQPVQTVYLDAYYIYKYPVTVRQYRQFCTATGRQMPTAPSFNANWSREDHPIVNVSWDDAMAYCGWAGSLLPTEAQWEKAARGMDGRRYPWGPEWNANLCVNNTNSGGGTKQVGSRPNGPSPYGALDMAGNVWEWCADWYDANYYPNSPSRNPYGPPEGRFRVVRGGSCNYTHARYFCCTYRRNQAPGTVSCFCGFRCVVRVDTE